MTEEHIREAIRSRRATAELLGEMVSVARPGEGAAKILIAVAGMAKPACDWIEGALRVELEGDGKTTILRVMEDLGGGVREIVFPRFVIPVPLAEFARGLRLAPQVVAPLSVREEGGKVVLARGMKRATVAPPTFALAEDCLRRSLPPRVRNSLAPAAPPKTLASRRRKRPGPPEPLPATIEIPRAPKILDFSALEGPRADVEEPRLRRRERPGVSRPPKR